MKLFQKMKRILRKSHPEKEAMEFCLKNGFTHGKNFQYNSGYPIDANFPWLISIGDDVTLASNVRILAHDASTVKVGAKTKVGIVSIGSNVFIGADSIVLCDTRIGDNVIVGAGSVVTKDVPSNSVVAGNPAKYICSFDEYKERHLKNKETHFVLTGHKWYEWATISDEEKMRVRKGLEDNFGYLE